MRACIVLVTLFFTSCAVVPPSTQALLAGGREIPRELYIGLTRMTFERMVIGFGKISEEHISYLNDERQEPVTEVMLRENGFIAFEKARAPSREMIDQPLPGVFVIEGAPALERYRQWFPTDSLRLENTQPHLWVMETHSSFRIFPWTSTGVFVFFLEGEEYPRELRGTSRKVGRDFFIQPPTIGSFMPGL